MTFASVFITLSFLATTASAQEHDSLMRYRASALSLEWSFFGGMAVQRAGAPADPGFFGGDAEVVFDGSPAALDDMATFRALRISGTVLWLAGLAMLVTDLSLLGQWVDEDGSLDPTFHGLLYGGLASGVIGGFMMQGANAYLSSAVSRYNTDLAERLQQRASGLPPRVFFTARF